MIPNVNPKQMGKLMAQMGIKSEEVEAERVVIEKRDGSSIVITDPAVTRIEMKGRASFQVAGNVGVEESGKKEEGDAEIIVKETGCSKEKAEKALEESDGDLAEAILKVQESSTE
jgi:nascent polypeptide-associated complex subunit alpha